MKFRNIILITFLLLAILTMSSVSATDNEGDNIENLQNNDETMDTINLNEESVENTLNVDDNEEVVELNNPSSEIIFDDNILNSQGDEVLGDSQSHSYKITIKPAKVYAHKKFSYSAKLTDNGEPVSGVYLELSLGERGYLAKTNSQGIATFKLDPEYEGKYDIEVEFGDEIDDDYAYADSYINVVYNPKAKTTVKAPKVTAKYKEKKYFKITVKNYKGKPIKKLKLTLDISTGKKWKIYHVKTNNKGVAKFNVKKLKSGSHTVSIYIDNPDTKYDLDKTSKIIIKKTAKKSSSKYKIITTKAKKYWITKKSGKFKVKTKIWDMTAGMMAPYKYIDTTLYKNGKQVTNTKYSVKYKINGKWTGWTKYGTVSTAHHRYSVLDSASVGQIKVKVKK